MRTLLTIVAICATLTFLSACTKNIESDIGPTKLSVKTGHPLDSAVPTEAPSELLEYQSQEVPKEVNVDDLGPFQEGISFDEIIYDEKYQDIVLLFQKNMTAWTTKDKKTFNDSFISEDAADSHMFFLEDSANYEFLGTPYIIDQSSENGRINIIFSYRTSKQVDEIKGNTMTFIKGEDNIWKIALID